MWGFFPALQSLQYQLPLGISMFRHSRWKAAGQDSQHKRLPPTAQEKSYIVKLRELGAQLLQMWTVKSSNSWIITFCADKAPADVDVFMVLDATSGCEVVRTDDAVVRKDNAASCHTEICGVIGNRAAHTSHQTACRRRQHNKQRFRMQTCWKKCWRPYMWESLLYL